MFRDITTLLKDPVGLRATVDELARRYKDVKIDKVAGIESRGFILGAPLAYVLGKGFIRSAERQTARRDHRPRLRTRVRHRPHRDPHRRDRQRRKGIAGDDLIATGGTAEAACKLIEKMGGKDRRCCFIINLPDIGGRARLEKHGHKVFALCEFEGD